ncbi:antileukoproteinase-like [Podarcis raffonei]|uniref:antileukoproteinase-like n=1 Tax=Podarcis raffonei TaxID=65483 RepID=UPI0023290F20|nr:antileukoproteinase-like [Podarcis raffonei]
MKTLVTFALVGLLALWLPFTACQKTPQGKPGICPIDRCRCTGPQPDECRDDYSCRGRKKCCYSCCAMRCVDPKFQNVESNIMKTLGAFLLLSILVLSSQMPPASGAGRPKEKPGQCPVVTVRCRMMNPPNHCNNDFDCTGSMKCCQGICGKDCIDPVFA